jgi:hypothetical protein
MLAKVGFRVVLELGLAFAVSREAAFLVNSPVYHYVSARAIEPILGKGLVSSTLSNSLIP